MTTVAGIAFGDGVALAADSQVTEDDGQAIYTGGKIWTHGEFIFGCAGSTRAIYSVQHVDARVFNYKDSTEVFMFLQLPVILHNEVMERGGKDTLLYLLIGHRGKLYEFDCSEPEINPLPEYHAIGSGGVYALGALYATTYDDSVTDRLTLAIEAGSYFDTSTGGAIEIVYHYR